MKKLTILLCVLVTAINLSAQTSFTEIKELAPDSSEYAYIHLYRPKALYGIIWNYDIKINGKKVKMKNGSYCKIAVKAGESNLKVIDFGKREMSFELEKGKDYFVQTYLRRAIFFAVPEIAEVTPRFAKGQIEKLK